MASSTCAAGTGFECGSVISSGPKGAGTLGSSDRILWSGDLVKTKIVTVSTYNDDSYNENIYNKSYSREFISLYVSISFLYSLNYILSIYFLCSENSWIKKYPILDIIFAFSHQLCCCKFTYIVGRNSFFINQRSEKIDISKAELILFSVHEGHKQGNRKYCSQEQS